MFIDKNTLSSIVPLFDENNNYSVSGYQLRIYKNGSIIFEKVYKTMKGAEIANTKLLRKYHSI